MSIADGAFSRKRFDGTTFPHMQIQRAENSGSWAPLVDRAMIGTYGFYYRRRDP